MARAIKCDRCGGFTDPIEYSPNDMALCTFTPAENHRYSSPYFKQVDLCENCLKDLTEWFSSKGGLTDKEKEDLKFWLSL